MPLKTEIAKELLNIKAVQIKTNEADYFTWTSGIKSPIYCDNRLTMSYPSVRNKIVQAFKQMIVEQNVKVDAIAGCATAGIPHAAWLAQTLDLPMVYVRSKPKGHGKENQIEGTFEAGKHVLVIEDLISTGGSALQAAQVLQEAGAVVENTFAIFSYGLKKSQEAFDAIDINLQTITGFDHLLDVLASENGINATEKERLIYWRNQL